VRILAAQVLPAPAAASVADGWGGDRLRVLARGDDLLLVWATAWDTPTDAAGFSDALPSILPEARAERRDDRVLVLLGPSEGPGPELATLAARVWARTSFSRPTP
jgi:hypothetical protein